MSCITFLRRLLVQEKRLLSTNVLSGSFLPYLRSNKDAGVALAKWEVEVEQRKIEFRERLVAGRAERYYGS